MTEPTAANDSVKSPRGGLSRILKGMAQGNMTPLIVQVNVKTTEVVGREMKTGEGLGPFGGPLLEQ